MGNGAKLTRLSRPGAQGNRGEPELHLRNTGLKSPFWGICAIALPHRPPNN